MSDFSLVLGFYFLFNICYLNKGVINFVVCQYDGVIFLRRFCGFDKIFFIIGLIRSIMLLVGGCVEMIFMGKDVSYCFCLF